jgi:hypothetical protein
MNGWNFKAQTFKYPDQDDKKHRFDYKNGLFCHEKLDPLLSQH